MTALKGHKQSHWHLGLEGWEAQAKELKIPMHPMLGLRPLLGGQWGTIVEFMAWEGLHFENASLAARWETGQSHSRETERKERKHLLAAVIEPKSTWRQPVVGSMYFCLLWALHVFFWLYFRWYFCLWNSIPSLITVNPFIFLSSVLLSLPLESPHCLLRSGCPAFGDIWGHTFLNNDRTWDTCFWVFWARP